MQFPIIWNLIQVGILLLQGDRGGRVVIFKKEFDKVIIYLSNINDYHFFSIFIFNYEKN